MKKLITYMLMGTMLFVTITGCGNSEKTNIVEEVQNNIEEESINDDVEETEIYSCVTF